MNRWILLLLLLICALPAAAQDDAAAREAALNAAQQRLGTRAQSWTFTILPPTSLSSLTCPLVQPEPLGREVIPFRFVLTYATGQYVVFASSDGTVVVLCDEKFNLPVSVPTSVPLELVPIVTPTSTPAPDACLLMPAGAFANVRANPSRDAAPVGQIFSGQQYAVLVQSSRADDRWYFITPGWVSAAVATVMGAACAALPIDDARVGTGAGITAPTADSNVAQTLALYACPPGFEGYLTPRIRVGTATARVGSGGLPNIIRSQPIVNDSIGARLGTIQPNRTIDRVINGPACSGGIVWWLVSVDDVQGWTAESDFARSAYFLEPLTSGTITAATMPAPAVPMGEGPLSIARREDSTGAGVVAVTDTGTFTLASDVFVGPDGTQTFVVAEYALDPANPTFTDRGVALPSEVTGVQMLADDRLAVSDGSRITVFQRADDQYVQQAVLAQPFPILAWAFTDDGRLYTTVEQQPEGVVVVLRSITSTDPLWLAQLAPDSVPFRVAFSPNTQSVAVLSFDGVIVFDSITGVQQTALSNATEQFGMLDMVFDPTDSTRLLTSICRRAEEGTQPPGGCAAGELTLWSLTDNTVVGVVETNEANPLHIAYATDGSRIYTGDAEGIIVVRDGGGTLLTTLDATGDRNVSIRDMALSRDGRSLVVSTSEGDLVWFAVE